MNDGELLRRYVRDGDEPAFRELVQRHLDMVHATATRCLGDPEAAKDVSQAVFCLLVHKAPGLFGVAELGGWLHRATCLKSSEHQRAERRRSIREQAAGFPSVAMISPTPEDAWSELAPVLDASLDQLDDTDRQLILWRFYRRRPFAEIASELRVSEDAARMRVNRALERLRRLLVPSLGTAWAGAVSAASGGLSLDGLLTQFVAGQAPSELASRVMAAAAEVAMRSGGSLPEPSRTGFGRLGWREGWIGGVAVLGVALIVTRLNRPEAGPLASDGSSGPGSVPATNSAVLRAGAAASRGLPASADASGRGGAATDLADLEARLAPLWRILRSPVSDGGFPPQDLRDCIAGLADQPQAVLEVLSRAINDPASTPATRERAVWGLWLVGEAAPATHSSIVTIAAGLIGGEEAGMLRWHASEVLNHLSVPEGAVEAVAAALQSRPDAWDSTRPFWESAARRRPDDVRRAVTPWLRREDGLRFHGAAILALLPEASASELAPLLLEEIPDGARQEMALRGLAALGRSANAYAPRLIEMLSAADRPGQRVLRERLIEVLAEIAPESRQDWSEIDAYLVEKEAVAEFMGKVTSNTATLADLVGGLKKNKTAWRAALELESLGPTAAEALPALREALAAPDCEHAHYLAKAIKAIEPMSPKPLFERDDLLPVLRSLTETVDEVGGAISSAAREELNQFIEDAQALTPGQLVERARQLGEIDPRLQETWVRELIKVDTALAGHLQE